MTQRQLPGGAFIAQLGSAQRQVPGVAFVASSVSSTFAVSGAGGFDTALAYGLPLVTPAGSFSVAPAGQASQLAYGTPSLSFAFAFTVTGAGGIGSQLAYGSPTLSFALSTPTLFFQASGMEFGRRTGLGISTFALDVGSGYRYSVYADTTTMGTAILNSALVTTDSTGKLPNFSSASLAFGTTYRIVAIRQADGEAAVFRMTAA